MSQKKAQQPQASKEDPSEIQIVTVGVKNPSTQMANAKDSHALLPLPTSETSAAVDAPKKEDQRQVKPFKELSESKSFQKPQEIIEIEDDENLDEDQDQSSNSQQSDKKAKSNDESPDERKDELPTSRKCFNKLCPSKKIYKKIRSRVQDNKYRFFCKNCYENYYNNLYCQFCQQIYSNNYENEDDDKWIGCDTCEKWNHIECQKKFRNKSINELKDKDTLYQCLVCSQKNKATNQKNKKQDKEQTEEKVATKQKVQISKDQRTLIFNKKIQTFPNLEYFLQNYSFRLWINESQIKQDIQHLRATCLKAQEDPVKNKFKKIKSD